MPDPVGGLAGELHGVGAADGQVAGVEAPGDVAVLEDPVDVARGLDDGLDVRVQDLTQAGVGADGVDLGEHPDEVGVLVAVEGPGHGPVVVHHRAGHQGRGPGAAEEVGHRTRAGQRLRRDGRGRAARAGRTPRAASCRGRRAPRGCPRGRWAGTRGAVLRGGDPQVRHLGQHSFGGQHVPPAGDLTDAPGDGGGRDAIEEGHGMTPMLCWNGPARMPHRGPKGHLHRPPAAPRRAVGRRPARARRSRLASLMCPALLLKGA